MFSPNIRFLLLFLFLFALPQMAMAASGYSSKANDSIFAITQQKLLEANISASASGFLEDALNPKNGTPDVSTLFSVGMATKSFEYGVFGCKYLTPDCSPTTDEMRRWDTDAVAVYVSTDYSDGMPEIESTYRKLFQKIYKLADIEVRFADDVENADVAVFIGGENYLLSKDHDHFDDQNFERDLLPYLQTIEAQGRGLYGDVFGRNPMGCPNVLSVNEKGAIKRTRIYVLKSDAEVCAAKSIFMSLGFEDNIQAVSSVLSHFNRFSDLTAIDKHLIHLLYSRQLSSGMGKSDVIAFAKNYFKENGYLNSDQDNRFTSYLHSHDARLEFVDGMGYEIDQEGYIVDGPRRTVSEPIDYSPILSERYINDFVRSCPDSGCNTEPLTLNPRSSVYIDLCGGPFEKSDIRKFLRRFIYLIDGLGGVFKSPKELKDAGTAVLISRVENLKECSDHPIYAGFDPKASGFNENETLSERLIGQCLVTNSNDQILLLMDRRNLLVCAGYFAMRSNGRNDPDSFLSTSFNPQNGYSSTTVFDMCYLSSIDRDVSEVTKVSEIYQCLKSQN